MYVRCADCLGSTWIDVIQPEGLVEAAECAECGRRHLLNPLEDLGSTARDHYKRSLNYSNQHDLDMASAYAVLLGVMSLEQAEVLRHSRMPEPAPDDDDIELGYEAEPSADAPAPPAPPTRNRIDRLPLIPDFDLGFAKAIAERHLTVQQAMSRGDRDAFAMRIVRKRGLPEDLAYRVTDNRISLKDAIELHAELELQCKRVAPERNRCEPVPLPGASTNRRRPKIGAFQALAVVALAALVTGAVIWSSWSKQVTEDNPAAKEAVEAIEPAPQPADIQPVSVAPARPEDPRLAATAVHKDDMGRVVSVVGPDPTSVLLAYCSASASALGLAPLEITSTVPRFRNARLGVFRDFNAPDATYAIRIRKDGRSGRWVAGDAGPTPVTVVPTPELPPDALRIPIKL